MQTALHPAGKLTVPARLNAIADGMLVVVQCQLTGRRHLVDMGAMFSLIPHKSSEPQAQHPRLIGPGSQPICCFIWTFIKAEVTFPILGVDFLRANRLSVSVTKKPTDRRQHR